MRLVYTDVSPLLSGSLFKLALHLVPEERKRHALAYACDNDRGLSLGASLLLAHCLDEIGFAPEKARFIYNRYGKPGIGQLTGWHFNLAHAGECAVCIAGASEAGVDVESVSGMDESVSAALHPDELAILGHSVQDRQRLYARLWTRKEAYLKAVGVGLHIISPATFSTLDSHGRLADEVEIAGQKYSIGEYSGGESVISICLPHASELPKLQYLPIEEIVESLAKRRQGANQLCPSACKGGQW